MRKQKIGLIGAGLMGHPMGLNWLKSGFDLTVLPSKSNKSKDRISDLKKNGATVVQNLKDLVSRVDVIILMLPTSVEVEKICINSGPNDGRLLDLCQSEQMIIDMTSADPRSTRKISKILNEKKLRFFDAPVTGGVKGAWEGTLTLFIGGPKPYFQETEELLKAISHVRTHFGEVGQGHVAKIINNYVCVGNLAVFSEALVLGAKLGLNSEAIFQTLLSGSGSSRMLELYGEQVLNGDFAPRFKLGHAFKDIKIVEKLNESIGKSFNDLPVLKGMIEDFARADLAGLAEENLSAIIKPIEERFGVSFRK